MSQADFIKTACQACEGRLELPVDSVGVAFACPRCGAKLKLTLKCACINCGGPLSFEVGHIGHTIQCGHCEGSTPLMPSAIVIHDTPTEKESEPELEPKPEPELEPNLEPEPEPDQTPPSSAVTQPLLTNRLESTSQTGDTSNVSKRPSAPKRPGGAGGPGGPTAPPPRRPDGSDGSKAPPRPVGVGGPGGPSAPKRPGGPQGPAPPKRPSDAGGPSASNGGQPKRPSQTANTTVPEGIKPPGQAPAMPKANGGSGASGGPPKKPTAVAGPQKQGGVSSPSQAAASREAALAKSKAAAAAASESAQDEDYKAEEKRQTSDKIRLGFVVLTLIGLLAWFVVLPYLGLHGPYFGYYASELIFPRKYSVRTGPVIKLPVFDVSDIKVDPAALSIRLGDAGVEELKGSVRNEGKNSVRNIKITVQITGGPEPIQISHMVNEEVKPGQTAKFSASLSFEVPASPEFIVEKIEILDPNLKPR